MVWESGKRLRGDRYTVQRVQRQTRYTISYLVENQDGTRGVIKTLSDEARILPDFSRLEEIFVGEAVNLARCRHPHIIQAEELFREEGVWCLPLEYVAGITFDELDLPLSEAEVLGYIRQVGEALTVAHQNQLLHRDVRPENIARRVQDGKPEAVLINFEQARKFDQDVSQMRTEELKQGFSPPELYTRDGSRGAFTDVYALGATLYNLLTGQVPVDAIARKLNEARLVPPKELNENISRETNRAIVWAMELETDKRPHSVEEWLAQFPGAMDESRESGEARRENTLPWWKSPVWGAVGAIATIVGIIVALVIAYYPRPFQDAPSVEESSP